MTSSKLIPNGGENELMIQNCAIDPGVAAPGNGWVKDYEEDCAGNAITRTYNATVAPMTNEARLLIKTNDRLAKALKVRNASHELVIAGNATGSSQDVSFHFGPGEKIMKVEVEISSEATSKVQSYPGLFCAWWPEVCARPEGSRIYEM